MKRELTEDTDFFDDEDLYKLICKVDLSTQEKRALFKV